VRLLEGTSRPRAKSPVGGLGYEIGLRFFYRLNDFDKHIKVYDNQLRSSRKALPLVAETP